MGVKYEPAADLTHCTVSVAHCIGLVKTWQTFYPENKVSLEWVENLKTVNKLFVDIRLPYFLSSSRITSIPVYILNSKNSEQIYSKWFLNMQRDYFQWTRKTPENEMVTLSKCGRVSLEMYGQFLVIAVHL